MTPDQLKAKAKALYDERQERAKSYSWNSSQERQKFLQRCRNLARQINVNAVDPDPQTHAIMYLDVIATREDVEFTFKNEK